MKSTTSCRSTAWMLAAVMGLGATAAAQNLVLWNTLDSRTDVENSVVGPSLRFATEANENHAFVTPVFVPGVFGNALTAEIGDDSPPVPHYHNVFLDEVNDHLSVERGTIQALVRIDRLPTPTVEGPYRIFSGPGEFGFSTIHLYVHRPADGSAAMLRFAMLPIFDPDEVEPLGIYIETPIDAYVGRFMQVDALWDRAGINGTTDKLRLYVNGTLVATTIDSDWGNDLGVIADIGGGDGAISGAFAVDELRIWDAALYPYPRAAFFSFGPGCEGAAGVPNITAQKGSLPILGKPFTMEITNLPDPRWCVAFAFLGVSRDYANGMALPLDLSPIGMTDCTLRVSTEFDFLMENHIGSCDWELLIPDDKALAGARFYTQIFALDASANPFGATMSNACEGWMGFDF